MSILELTIGRAIYLIEKITRFLVEENFPIFKSIIFIVSLFFSLFLVFLWFKYELKNRDEIDKWEFYFQVIKNYFFLKNPRKNFEEIKKIFYQDKILAFKELNKFLDFVLETFGYQGSLEEKIEKVNPEFVSNLEDLKKAIEAVKIIQEKSEKNEEINLTEEEYLYLFHQYEVALFDLNIINKEDFLVTNLK